MKSVTRDLTSRHIESISFGADEEALSVLREQIALTQDDPDFLRVYEYVYGKLRHTMTTGNDICVIERTSFLSSCERDGIDPERGETVWRRFCRPFND